MKTLLLILIFALSSYSASPSDQYRDCFVSNKIDTTNLLNQMHNSQSNVGHESMELTMSKSSWVLVYEGYTKCGIDLGEELTGDIQRTMTTYNNIITITESSLHTGFSVTFNWYNNGLRDTTTAYSEYLVSGLSSSVSPIQTFGKFTDKDDAIIRAKQLWRSGKYYSIAVGNFCKKTSNSPSAIYVCRDIVYRSKN